MTVIVAKFSQAPGLYPWISHHNQHSLEWVSAWGWTSQLVCETQTLEITSLLLTSLCSYQRAISLMTWRPGPSPLWPLTSYWPGKVNLLVSTIVSPCIKWRGWVIHSLRPVSNIPWVNDFQQMPNLSLSLSTCTYTQKHTYPPTSLLLS